MARITSPPTLHMPSKAITLGCPLDSFIHWTSVRILWGLLVGTRCFKARPFPVPSFLARYTVLNVPSPTCFSSVYHFEIGREEKIFLARSHRGLGGSEATGDLLERASALLASPGDWRWESLERGEARLD